MAVTDTEKAYQQIRKQIIKTELKPGSIIKESALMTELSIGRTPVREALKQLQIEHLVIVKPRRGIFVADISITDMLQLFEIRVELESLAVRLATKRITPEEFSNLKGLSKDYAQIDLRDKRSLIELDGKFHCSIAEASHNKFLRHDIAHYYDLSARIWYLAIELTSPEDINIKAHLRILEAIEAGDADQAAEGIAKHIKDSHKSIKNYL